ncbi:MAG: Nif3-like dinuclear metal center hexameric protein [Desulfobacterales bacterium]|nr:Nif3-like dinuclear metal center hexameric protein [Desulfobacterales bacterium]
MPAIIADIIKIMEDIAPSRLAEEWDNVGLQVGQKDWPVRTIRIALDPLPGVVAAACKEGVDLLITHHPLIFKPLGSVDFGTPVGAIINMASKHKMAIFAAHTNLDNVTDGLNDILARMIGLNNLEVLGKPIEPEYYKLVVYLPVEYEQKILTSLFETKAGSIGAYTSCSFRNNGRATFRPGSLSKPFTGKPDNISHADEIRLETVVQKDDLENVIEHVRANHPYETMAYDVYRLQPSDSMLAVRQQGLGRIGDLAEETKLLSLALEIKKKLCLNFIKVAGKPDLSVKKVALCTGSGSSLINNFFVSGAQAYISGDFRYHDARAAEAANLGIIDIGHFASEHLIVKVLAKRLKEIIFKTGIDLKVEACESEIDPFVIL